MVSWKETSPGIYERPFDSIERFFFNLARSSLALDREHWSVSTFAQFKSEESRDHTQAALRKAWEIMRYDHPQIACVARQETIVYEVPDNATLEAWLDETFIIAPTSATKEELLASFRPSARATLHFLPSSSELMIHSSHWRIDLIGALALLQNLLTAVAEPRQVHFGDEGKNLSPSRDESANYSSSTTMRSPTQIDGTIQSATDLVMQLINNLPSIGLPAHNVSKMPGATRRAEVVVGHDMTSAIVSASKKRGLTVTTALHAALIVALHQSSTDPPSPSDRYTSWGVFNIRPLLKVPFDNPAVHPVGVNIAGLPLTLQISSYADLALQLQRYYEQRLPPAAERQFEGEVLVSYTNQMADLAGRPPPTDFPAPSEPMLSSVGIVDSYLKNKYGSIEVTEFWVGVEMTTPQVVCYLWTWQGHMTLSALYNETFYDERFVQEFLGRIMQILLSELAILL